jgi:gamma-glutamyl:cysteine ligase YbdK (ATP-grasp superfamily)
MRYDFNGKSINIPDAELEKSMKILGMTKEEAIEMWLEDEGYLDNEEQAELEQKAKENKITATIHGASATEKKKQSKPKTVKVSDEKQRLFKELSAVIKEYCIDEGGKCEILKENKLIQVEIGGKIFNIDLIEQRKPKK